jgi:hypothetical protein
MTGRPLMRIDRTLLTACLLLLTPIVHAGEAMPLPGIDAASAGQSEEKLDELETVVIAGGFATPRMWKVLKDDHVMWVLGQQAVPAGVQWRLEKVEARVADSQLVLFPGSSKLDMDVGFFRIVTLVPAAFKAAKNPGKKTLKDVLPPDVYARWRTIKTTYVGRDNDIEEWRPAIAIIMLWDKVGDKLGPLQSNPAAPPVSPPAKPVLRPLIDRVAKKHKVKVRTMPTVEREIKVRNVGEMLKSVRESSAMEVKCFTQTLGHLERLIEYAKQKASGAAQNDAAPPRHENCDDFLIKGMRNGEIPDPAGILKVLDDITLQGNLGREQRDAEWIAAAQAAIAKNKSTFTMLSMNQIMSPTGYLAKLRELGYGVEEPE